MEELLHQERWFKGPDFLWKEEALWPIPPSPLQSISDEDPEVNRQGQANQTTTLAKESKLDLMIQRYSSWSKLKRGVAYLLRFKEFIRRKRYPRDDSLPLGDLSLEELRSAELHIVKYVQKSPFPEILDILQASSSRNQEKRALSRGSPGSRTDA